MMSEEENRKNDILVVIDGSYFLYYVLFGAVNKWMTNSKLEAKTMIKPAEETDQSALPDLLVSDSFKKELKKATIKRCEMVDFILKKNFQDKLDMCSNIDILFVLDDYLKNSFRKDLYPEYKAQRRFTKRSYRVDTLKDYIVDVLFKDLNITQEYGYKMVHVHGAEGDDVIACTMKNMNGYMTKILFASDHDFLQLEDVEQYDLRGDKVVQKIKVKGEEIVLDPKTALMIKILVGDGADNIPSIADKMGPVKAYKFANDREKLKEYLSENQDAAKQFMINRKLIDFNSIPESLSESIVSEVKTLITERKTSVQDIDDNLRSLMDL